MPLTFPVIAHCVLKPAYEYLATLPLRTNAGAMGGAVSRHDTTYHAVALDLITPLDPELTSAA